jgi:hypothetical protein
VVRFFEFLRGDLPYDPVRIKLQLGLIAAGKRAGLRIEQAQGAKPDILQENQGAPA